MQLNCVKQVNCVLNLTRDLLGVLLAGPPGLTGYVDAFRIYATSFALDVTEVGESTSSSDEPQQAKQPQP